MQLLKIVVEKVAAQSALPSVVSAEPAHLLILEKVEDDGRWRCGRKIAIKRSKKRGQT